MIDHVFSSKNSCWLLLAADPQKPWEIILKLPDVLSRLLGNSANFVHPTSWIHPSAQITNSYLGEGVKIYEGCSVRDSVILDGTTIGHCGEIARSVILQNCMIPRFNYVGSSLLGEGVTLGGMTMLASARHDWQNVVLQLDGWTVNTGQAKFGSLVGDGANIAYGCHVNPGSVIGRDSLITAMTDWRGFCPAHTMVITRRRILRTRRRPLRLRDEGVANPG